MTWTYEANLLCGHPDCLGACVTGAPMETPQDSRASAKREALAEGWSFASGKATCPECVARIAPPHTTETAHV